MLSIRINNALTLGTISTINPYPSMSKGCKPFWIESGASIFIFQPISRRRSNGLT